uniref:Pimeloyl-ACP methyl ester carboxylesterase n=1 Tax=Candidatus Kentrum sp. DK TaxID=2126562 RepID=A0A450S869_9GAMM|nr:MAG: Pimeloyl-ACP methyl ester carboxylesterase [Candidatus Kentron sp. DK]
MNLHEEHLIFTCRDGLSLFCRDFHDDSPAFRDREKTPVLCLPGLTRNSKDFIPLARRHGGRRRFVCPDFRGRGLSAWDPDPTRYHPTTYVEDMWELLARLDIPRVVIIGTSLGGLMAMLMANLRSEAVAGIVLNDIGPEVNPLGLARVSGYVGRLSDVKDWDEATRQVREVYEIALPDLDEDAWREYTGWQYREDGTGVPRLEYDPALGDTLRDRGGVPPDLWPLFEGLRGVPVLALRGTLSDILSQETFDRMRAVKPDTRAVLVPDRGHVPILNEPVCIRAMDAFLDEIE